MRKTSLLILCVLSSWIGWSQVNEDFETWITNNEALQPYKWQSPVDWSTSNNVTEFIAHSVLQSTDSHSGQYAALLSSHVILGQLRPGVLFYGDADYNYASLTVLPKGGKIMESQRVRINGWYKYHSDHPGNLGLSIINVVRIDPSSGESTLLAQFQKPLPIISEYTQFEYTIEAVNNFNPATDHFQLLFYSNSPGDLQGKSELWIDELQIINAVFANAGADTTLCVGIESSLDTLALGHLPTANGGIGPYTYSWMTDYYSAGNHYTASDFLNDTSLANPLLIDYIDSALTFYLTVTDSEGNTAEDSIKINFSSWIVSTDYKFCHFVQGDSCQLYTSFHGGILPHVYLWTPSDGLSDVTDLNAWASPAENTSYILQITDAAGCQVHDMFDVFVDPTSTDVHDIAKVKSYVFPNPVVDQSFLTVLFSDKATLSLVIYNSLGRLIKQVNRFGEPYLLNRKDFFDGIYYYLITSEGNQISEGRFLVK